MPRDCSPEHCGYAYRTLWLCLQSPENRVDKQNMPPVAQQIILGQSSSAGALEGTLCLDMRSHTKGKERGPRADPPAPGTSKAADGGEGVGLAFPFPHRSLLGGSMALGALGSLALALP